MSILTVSDLNNQIKSLLESTFEQVSVQGEVSNVTYHTSGHIYFSIKDKNASIKCVMFRGNATRLKFKLERGLHIICSAAISAYVPRGDYQLNCFSITPAGEGALALAYEQLKKKLEKKGYFDKSTKKQLPRVPKKIVLITSATGAALQDMLKIANKRWKLLKIVLINTIVQGDSASKNIAKNITFADTLKCDVIVISRGGGSIEDLWAFNEEIVADAIYNAKTPIISAVGHEVDFVISDFVSDIRAPTPSSAMEILLPDQVEILQYIDTLSDRFTINIKTLFNKKNEELKYLKNILQSRSMSQKVNFLLNETSIIKKSMIQAKEYFLNNKQTQLSFLLQRFVDSNPKTKIAINSAQIVKNEKSISLSGVEIGDTFVVIDSKVKIEAKAIKKEGL